MALCLKIFGLFYPFLSSSHCLVLEGLSCIWGIFPGGPGTLGSHLVHSCTHVSSWFPHCSEVPWESYSGGVPFCRFLGSPILHWVMCVCFTLSDCVLSGLKGFLFWCLLLLHPPNCGAFGCSWHFLCWPGSSLGSFCLHHHLGGSGSCFSLLSATIGSLCLCFWFACCGPILPVPVLSCYCCLAQYPSCPVSFCTSGVLCWAFPVGMGCLSFFF